MNFFLDGYAVCLAGTD